MGWNQTEPWLKIRVVGMHAGLDIVETETDLKGSGDDTLCGHLGGALQHGRVPSLFNFIKRTGHFQIYTKKTTIVMSITVLTV